MRLCPTLDLPSLHWLRLIIYQDPTLYRLFQSFSRPLFMIGRFSTALRHLLRLNLFANLDMARALPECIYLQTKPGAYTS